MKISKKLLLLLTFVLFNGCLSTFFNTKNYEEIPSMLTNITRNAQMAIKKGHDKNGEEAILKYIQEKNPDIYSWFQEQGYKIKVKKVDAYAVVLICDKDEPLFEDTYCNSGKPDKDYTEQSKVGPCEVTMTIDEVRKICKK